MGVIELSSEELKNIDGGNWFTDFVMVSAYLAGDTIGSFMKGFEEGFNDSTKNHV